MCVYQIDRNYRGFSAEHRYLTGGYVSFSTAVLLVTIGLFSRTCSTNRMPADSNELRFTIVIVSSFPAKRCWFYVYKVSIR